MVVGKVWGPLLALCAIAGVADAADAFKPESVTVEARIKPGPNLLVLDQGWSGASRLTTLSADDLSNKGSVSMGLEAQYTVSKDKRTAYGMSVYAKRIMWGPEEVVLEEFDLATQTVRREIALSEKSVHGGAQANMLALSDDEQFILVQNATPATSVSVVDLKAGKVIDEVPTPGCFGVYAAPSGHRFSTLCGDGTLASYEYTAAGQHSAPVRSAKFFDTDTDPVYPTALRAGSSWLFLSFNGNVLRVSDAASKAVLESRFALATGVAGNWAPGGVQLMAYSPQHQVLFVAMHPDAREGSHKDAAKEVWAVDLKRQKVLYRSVVEPVKSLVLLDQESPLLFGLNETGLLYRYEVDPEAKFALKPTHKVSNAGQFTVLGSAGGAL
ncbi:amine dehydrogenase [Duganella sp. FT80W]|uniref:Amine dehydrogenase n=1 Tax=Duganella guangzhouensis TaxID=2666084 RepID=A0A6I2KTG8_9BURK|nr:amine dehydrogenase large subunit [Duganella guangzhouensis]MRW89235.1 amine dehydrogenase [Duganella guangzhouensis]